MPPLFRKLPWIVQVQMERLKTATAMGDRIYRNFVQFDFGQAGSQGLLNSDQGDHHGESTMQQLQRHGQMPTLQRNETLRLPWIRASGSVPRSMHPVPELGCLPVVRGLRTTIVTLTSAISRKEDLWVTSIFAILRGITGIARE